MKKVFENYPKKRIELSGRYKKIYLEHYKKNREGLTTASSLSKKMESWLHRKVAGDVKNDTGKKTLEIGAGTLNHLQYEKNKVYDIVEPFKDLYIESPDLKKVNKIFNNLNEVPENNKYDRIVSIATFEHILDLPDMVAKCCLLLKEEGYLRVSIPNEGSLLWKIGWKLTTGLEFRLKYNLSYEKLLKYEHVNTASEVEMILKYFFKNIRISFLGLNKKFAFYLFFECSDPETILAKDFLRNK